MSSHKEIQEILNKRQIPYRIVEEILEINLDKLTNSQFKFIIKLFKEDE